MSVADEVPAPSDVLWRAMSATRMLDCGVSHGDVLALQTLTAQGVAWDVALERLAVAQRARATDAHERGHLVTAVEAMRCAAADLMFAQMAFNLDGERKCTLYARFQDAVARAGALAGWEHLEPEYAHGRLTGWLIRPDRPSRGTVIVLGGQSGWGAAYLRAADALTARGLSALLVEGPGQGTPRMSSGLMLDVDVRAAYRTFVDHVLARPELGGTVGLWGNSMGGLYAGTTAAADPRVAAVCVNGAPASPRLLGFRTFDEQAAAMLGTDDLDAVQRNLDRIALQPGDQIDGAVLVVHGGADPIVSLAEQRPFLEAATHDDTTLRVWEDGEHTIYNHADERTSYVADWFIDRLAPDHHEGA